MAVTLTLVDTLGEFGNPDFPLVAVGTLGEFDEFMLLGQLDFSFKKPDPRFVFQKPVVGVKLKKPTVEVIVI